jgi:hypothetical protein
MHAQCNIVMATCKSQDRQRSWRQLIDGRVAALSVQSCPVVCAPVHVYVYVSVCVFISAYYVRVASFKPYRRGRDKYLFQ